MDKFLVPYTHDDYIFLHYWGTTSDATETEIFLNGQTDMRFIVPENEVIGFNLRVSAKRIETSMECAFYEIKGVIKNDDGTVSLAGSTKTVVHEDDSTWDVNVSADDVNDSLVVKVLGATD